MRLDSTDTVQQRAVQCALAAGVKMPACAVPTEPAAGVKMWWHTLLVEYSCKYRITISVGRAILYAHAAHTLPHSNAHGRMRLATRRASTVPRDCC